MDEQASNALIARIERMSYEDMVRALRQAEIGDPMFLGDPGVVFSRRLVALRAELSAEANG